MTRVSETSRTSGPVTVGVDIGTTSVKAVAADRDGKVLARTRVPHRLITEPPGAFEHEPDTAWRTDVVRALRDVAEGHEVAAVNVAAMVPSLTAVDSDGHALTPGLLYGDARGEHERSDPDLPGDGGELLAFVRWAAAEAPDAAGYWPAQAVANHALAGEGVIDRYTAMSTFPLFDLTRWDEDLARSAGTATDRLPRIVGQFEAAGRVADGLPASGALLGGGTVDAYGEQLVAGADEPGDVLVICGTTLITWAVTDTPCTASGLWSIPHPMPGRFCIGGPSNAGGLFQDRIARLVAIQARDEIEPEPGLDPAEVPVWLPYVRGERTPLHRRDLRAGLFDLGLHHGSPAVVRAAQEATAFVVRHHIELATAAGFVPKRIVATGGGTRSDGLMQALADGTGLAVDVAAIPEGAALGSAYLARCAAGFSDGLDGAAAWARTGHRVEPRRSWADACTVRYRRFRSLTDAALAAR